MNKLIIIGARAMGRETCAYARECGMEVKGFLDSNIEALSNFEGYPPIIDSVEDYFPCDDDMFVVALGEPEYKVRYAQIIAEKGGRFVSVIHPSAYIGSNVNIGAGSIICPHTTITSDVTVGRHVIVNVNASINHDSYIGEFSTLCPGCRIAGRVRIGMSVFVGTGATIIPDVKLVDKVFVAAGAVVVRDVPNAGCIMGIPAKFRSGSQGEQ